ncbi:hypothetical protein Rrhod_2674 [Rhodococcus rhodnii LMG 5362]|uniref:Serine aminopeptidase S33 domain-containing protein n=2 Tax=Rhodococcus rhodnii TaxID=38312 RepID=R7WL34_9NOCA|nr:hypothetical protein Rrhod_2674 [Rhodococcus rhodnii LMG 5362]
MTGVMESDARARWRPDVLGDGYEQLTIELGPDPDGEGENVATLVRYQPSGASHDRAVLYVHGFTDYFFQRHVAEHFHEQGYAFYALDLHKCGRSRREGQTPHFATDLRDYDAEIDRALALARSEIGGGPVLLAAHSTGGLILPLWLDAHRRRGTEDLGVMGLVLNSPWFDLQGPAVLRSFGTALVDVVGRVSGHTTIPLASLDAYGASLHVERRGEWTYDLEWKPLTGFPVRFGWLRAVRRAHARLHRGLDIGVPALVLRSTKSYGRDPDVADLVLDVRQIARWAGCLGDRTTIVPIDGARHDVFLSREEPRRRAFAEVDRWLAEIDEYAAPAEPRP